MRADADEAVIVEALEGRFLEAEVASIEEDHVLVRLDGWTGDMSKASRGGEGGGRIKFEADGVVPLGDFRVAQSDPPEVAVGDRFLVHVEQRTNDGRRWIVSRDKARRLKAFETVLEAYRSGQTVEGEVAGTIEGGFSVDVGVRAFLPASQVAMRPIRRSDDILGQRFTFKIIRFDRSRQNVVLSRRVLLEAERNERLERLKVGAVVEGTVKSFTDYGAFVDIGGGVEGLLHLEEMSWGRLRRPQEAVALGDRLTLTVINLDKAKMRISLSLRQLQDDPWLIVSKKYPLQSTVHGLVVSKTDVGCFLEIEPGLEGLVFSKGPMVGPRDAAILRKVDIGDEISARVVDIDLGARRMTLVVAHEDS